MHTSSAVALVAAAMTAPVLCFAPAAAGGAPQQLRAHRRTSRCCAPAAGGLKMGIFDSILPGNKPDEKAVVFKAWSTKDVVEGPKGAGLKGDIEVIFKIGDEDTKTTKCFAGQPLSEVATQVPYLLQPYLAACKLEPFRFLRRCSSVEEDSFILC
jgi:hypothetical protein